MEDLARSVAVASGGGVSHARNVMSGAEARSELLDLQKVLEPPRATPRQVTDADRTQEFGWIVENRDAYRGRWVAIQGGELVAYAPSSAELPSRIKNIEGVPLVHRIP